jgi:hypothetical protein
MSEGRCEGDCLNDSIRHRRFSSPQCGKLGALHIELEQVDPINGVITDRVVDRHHGDALFVGTHITEIGVAPVVDGSGTISR